VSHKIVQICIDDSTIAGGDPMKVIEPVWCLANISDGAEKYQTSLMQFSQAQRFVHAMMWYWSEVNNGGHYQFYSNSTGIVWKDVMSAFQILELPEFASILKESTERLGGDPSLDRHVRNEQLDTFEPDFSDLDDEFYAMDKKMNLNDRIMSFIRTRPKDFYFDGKFRSIYPEG
jgi:hypothetical protein